MHYGNIKGYTKPGQVYRYLSDRYGQWCDAYEIQADCKTTALSTRISEVRAQLDPRFEWVEVEQRGRRWYYRLVVVQEQMELVV